MTKIQGQDRRIIYLLFLIGLTFLGCKSFEMNKNIKSLNAGEDVETQKRYSKKKLTLLTTYQIQLNEFRKSSKDSIKCSYDSTPVKLIIPKRELLGITFKPRNAVEIEVPKTNRENGIFFQNVKDFLLQMDSMTRELIKAQDTIIKVDNKYHESVQEYFDSLDRKIAYRFDSLAFVNCLNTVRIKNLVDVQRNVELKIARANATIGLRPNLLQSLFKTSRYREYQKFVQGTKNENN